MLGEKASQTMKQISLSNDTIKSRIHETSDNIKSKVIAKTDSSPVFALQLDECTDVSNLSQLLVYSRYMLQTKRFMRNFSSANLWKQHQRQPMFFKCWLSFWQNWIELCKLVEVCTDGAPAMNGANSGLASLVKQKIPAIQGTHCMIHKAALASKTIPKRLHEHLSVVVKSGSHRRRQALKWSVKALRVKSASR